MPTSFVVDPARRLVFIRYWGVLTTDDLVVMNLEVQQDERMTDGFDRLANLSEVTEIRIPSEGIRTIAEIARQAPVGRRALVAPNALIFGLSRMFEQNLRLGANATKVFHDLPSALEFLGHDRATPWPSDPPHIVSGEK